MSQDTFNKIITITLFAFFMVMYTIGFITGRTIDWNQLLVFIVPTLNHIVHQYTQAQVTKTNIEANTQTTVAQITATGTNGTPPQMVAVGAVPRG